MVRNHLKRLSAGVVVLGMVCSMASVAGADDITSTAPDAPAAVTVSGTVNVWVVASQDEVNGDVDHGACNIGGNNGPHVVASLTSSDEAVATVAPATMDFSACGDTNAQTATITLLPDLCLTRTATITIAESWRGPGNSVKGMFNTETINVSVAPSNPTDTSCSGDGGGGSTLCSEPAAPAWAAALLKASSGLKPKQSKQTANYISQVAHNMTNGAVFEGLAKSNPGYADAVRAWMVDPANLGLTSLATVDAARAIRPEWTCSPATVS